MSLAIVLLRHLWRTRVRVCVCGSERASSSICLTTVSEKGEEEEQGILETSGKPRSK